jgi:uncharacterized membrane protein YedE/YeeE
MNRPTLLLLIVTSLLAGAATPLIVESSTPSAASLAVVTPSEAQAMIDHAARQTDRWLFLATGGIFGGCLLFAVGYQTKWVRNLVADLRQDRREQSEIIKDNSTLLTRVCDRLDRDSHNAR